jgi:methylated-DNA-[protein]-cysteine S-methyltransferase
MNAMRLVQPARSTTLEIPSPLGRLALEAKAGRLTALRFDGRGGAGGPAGPELAAAAEQLAQYFAGHRRAFQLPLELPRGPFDRRVLTAVGEIPHGERTSYGKLTATLGLQPEDVRMVAAAIARNPLPILLPCHRVVGADGRLIGYGGGLDRKAQLLALEAGQLQLVAAAQRVERVTASTTLPRRAISTSVSRTCR